MQINFIPSKYQWGIFAFVQNGSGHGVVEAVAGSGKTTTIVLATQLTKTTDRVAFVAFNRHIARELQERAPYHVHVSTLNSLGNSNIRNAQRNIQFDADKLKHIMANHQANGYNGPVKRLVSLCKANLLEPTPSNLDYISDRWDVDVDDGNRAQVFDLAATVYHESVQQTNVIDYDDQIFLPATGQVGCEKFDVLLVDECLPYRMPVLLADGSSIPIGDVVENHIEDKVLAYDESTGKQKACQIIGWHKIPNTKPLVKVRVKWSQRKGTNTPHNFIVCTTNHKVWTQNGYIEASKLKPGMIVQVETSALKSQAYKITTPGRETLSKLMAKKNDAGLMGSNPPTGWTGKRGGNGKPMPVPQKLLLAALGEGWESEYPVLTKQVGGQNAGFPNCYKIDIANPSMMTAIEVDGNSHKARKHKDAKKDKCLDRLGWTVYRFDNWEIMQNLKAIAAQFQDCPISATVVSVEPIAIKEWYVYDITVEDCHNFYANGILVHNCQDLNKAQIALALRSVADGGRIIAVGDRYQSCYGFRGADTDAIPNIIEALSATTLPLSICYRCPLKHVKQAQQLVPQIEAREGAPEGVLGDLPRDKLAEMVQPGDMVLCRCNAPLVPPALNLIRQGIKAVIIGRDIGKGLMALLRKIQKSTGTFSLDETLWELERYADREVAKLYQTDHAMRAQSLRDRVETILALSDGCLSIGDLQTKVNTVFSDDKQGIAFSTVHKAKGLEADRVFILEPQLMPHPKAKKSWEQQQERNILYVAWTRAKQERYDVR